MSHYSCFYILDKHAYIHRMFSNISYNNKTYNNVKLNMKFFK